MTIKILLQKMTRPSQCLTKNLARQTRHYFKNFETTSKILLWQKLAPRAKFHYDKMGLTIKILSQNIGMSGKTLLQKNLARRSRFFLKRLKLLVWLFHYKFGIPGKILMRRIWHDGRLLRRQNAKASTRSKNAPFAHGSTSKKICPSNQKFEVLWYFCHTFKRVVLK